MGKVDYVVKWGDLLKEFNNQINCIYLGTSYSENVGNSATKYIKELYRVLEEDSEQELNETIEKEFQDLTESYCNLNIKMKNSYKHLTDTENFFIIALLNKREKEIKRNCQYILSEKKLIKEANPIKDRDYLYYINSLSWYNMKLDNFKKSLYASGLKKRQDKKQHKLKNKRYRELYTQEFLIDIRGQ